MTDMTLLNLILLFVSPFADIVLLYIGPETFMPILSALAALGGVVLMFWRHVMAFFRKVFSFFRRKDEAESAE